MDHIIRQKHRSSLKLDAQSKQLEGFRAFRDSNGDLRGFRSLQGLGGLGKEFEDTLTKLLHFSFRFHSFPSGLFGLRGKERKSFLSYFMLFYLFLICLSQFQRSTPHSLCLVGPNSAAKRKAGGREAKFISDSSAPRLWRGICVAPMAVRLDRMESNVRRKPTKRV